MRLSELLAERKDTTVEQAMTTLVLAGWAINQPGDAPTLDFIRKYNRIEIQIHRGREEVGEEKQRWREALADYPYAWTDDFDEVIIDGVALGYFDEGRLKAAALAAENRNRDGEHNTAFSRAWRDLYHGSLVVDDDEFLDELHRTAIQDAKSITPLNINSAIRILRDNGRGHQADDIITKYIHAREEEGREFFKIDRHHFSRDDRVDDRLRAAFADRLAGFVDARTPIEALRYMIENHTRDDPKIEIFSRLTSDDFEQLFESLRGDDVGKGINSIFRLGRADHEKSAGLLAAATEALRKIAAKSPLRRQKLRRFGIELDAPPVNDADN